MANATIGEINTTLANVINNTNSTPEKEDDGGFVPGLHFGPDSNSISFNEAIPIDDYDDGGVPTWLTVTGIVIVAIGALFGIGSIGIFACI